MVVTEAGQHQNGEPLNEKSKGRVFDRNDGKIIGTSQCDRTIGVAPPTPYQWRGECESIPYGYTSLSFEEIQKLGMHLTLSSSLVLVALADFG